MGKINQHKLRSLNGRIGYLKRNENGGFDFVAIHTGKVAFKDLRKWEIKEAIKNPRKEEDYKK
jgi:hypothetical protein